MINFVVREIPARWCCFISIHRDSGAFAGLWDVNCDTFGYYFTADFNTLITTYCYLTYCYSFMHLGHVNWLISVWFIGAPPCFTSNEHQMALTLRESELSITLQGSSCLVSFITHQFVWQSWHVNTRPAGNACFNGHWLFLRISYFQLSCLSWFIFIF